MRKTIGVVGMGRIGSMLMRRLTGFKMKKLYYNRSRKEDLEKELGVEYQEFDSLLAASDFVSLHIPLTEETHHLINKDAFAKMKKGAYLVNTSRGPVVDEHDLVNVLRDGHLAGAGLDVFDNEPNVSPELLEMENVIMTPHIASATIEARNKMGEQAVSAILDTLEGKKPQNIINEEVWNKRRK